MIGVVDADGVKHVHVGPMGAADGVKLWFLGTGPDAAADVYYRESKSNLLSGWSGSISDGSVLSIDNPNGTDEVEVDVVIIGVDS